MISIARLTVRKEDGRMKKYVIIAVILILAVVVFPLGYKLVADKHVILNKLFVSDTDVIGADISMFQGDTDMAKLKEQGIQFVIIKATEGSTYKDEYFAANWQNAKEAGLPAGAYHFFSFESSGKTQAANFINTVGPVGGRLLPVVDVEFYGNFHVERPKKEDLIRELQDYLDALEEEYGIKPMIYTDPEINKKYLKGTFDAYPKWLRSVYYPLSIQAGDDWYIWQYTDRGELEGYSGHEKYIDLNVLNKKITLDAVTVKTE